MGSVHTKICKMLPVCVYSCDLKWFQTNFLCRVCLHYKVLFHRRQFLPPLYERRLEVSLMLMSNCPIHYHYIPRVDEHIQVYFSKDFLDTRNLRAFRRFILFQAFIEMLTMCSSQNECLIRHGGRLLLYSGFLPIDLTRHINMPTGYQFTSPDAQILPTEHSHTRQDLQRLALDYRLKQE